MLDLNSPDGKRVVFMATDVEGSFVGLSITEHAGLEMRKVGAELHDLDDIQTLRDTLSAFLGRHGR